MGWFDINNIEYSDETLDLAYSFLEEFTSIYERSLKRKPNIEELEHLLQTSFCSNLDDRFVSNFEEKKIESVKFKIGKRKKKLKYEVGDMCATPLPCGGYAFTRIVKLQPPSWYVSEVFAYYSHDKVYRPEIEKAGYLMYPMFITPKDYEALGGDIIHKIPDYAPENINELYYIYGLPGGYFLTKIGEKFGTLISDEEASKYTKQTFYHHVDLIKKIQDALMEKGLLK